MFSFKTLAIIGLCVPLALLFTACGGDDDDDNDSLTGVVWGWTEFDSEDGDDIEVSDPGQYTIEFTSDDGAFNIKADCNQGNGQATIDGNNITIGNFALTMAFCGEESLDQDYIRLLNEVESFDRDGDNLTFELKDNAGEMEFEAQ